MTQESEKEPSKELGRIARSQGRRKGPGKIERGDGRVHECTASWYTGRGLTVTRNGIGRFSGRMCNGVVDILKHLVAAV